MFLAIVPLVHLDRFAPPTRREQRIRDTGKGFEVIACLDGRGFGIRRADVKKLLLAAKGKVYSLKTVDRIVDTTGLANILPPPN